MLVPGSDFKSDGSCGDAAPAGSIPVRFRRAILRGASCALAALAIACAGSSQHDTATAAEAEGGFAPAWVLGDCRAHWRAEGRRVLCGVGSADGSENRDLVRATAVARARAALEAALAPAVKGMLLDYAATETGRRDFNPAYDGERHIARAAREVTETTLAEASVTDTWQSPSDVDYVLIALDADAFSAAVRGMTQLRPSLRQALTERADAAFAAR